MGKAKFRFLSCLLALVLCLTCLTLPAFAQSNEPKDEVIIYTGDPNAKPPASTQETKPSATNPTSTSPTTPPDTTPPATEPEPTVADPGAPFTEGSDIVTRDMLYDKATNKQFITIQDRDGNYFYLVIDYDAPLNEDEEGYQVYFLNPVDAADLGALVKTEPTDPAVCICTQHCQAGAIRMDCPVCASNMAECAGSIPEPTTEPTVPETEPEPEPEKSSGAGAVLIVLLMVALIGGVGWYFLKNRLPLPKTKGDTDLDDYDYGEDDPWENEDEADGEADEESEGSQP